MASPTDRTHTIAVFCEFEKLAIWTCGIVLSFALTCCARHESKTASSIPEPEIPIPSSYVIRKESGYDLTAGELMVILQMLKDKGLKGKPTIYVGPALPGRARAIHATEPEEVNGREINKRTFYLREPQDEEDASPPYFGWRASIGTLRSVFVNAKGSKHRVSVPDNMTADEAQVLVDAFMAIKHDRNREIELKFLREQNRDLVPVRIGRSDVPNEFDVMLTWRVGYRGVLENGKMEIKAWVGINI